MSTSLLEKLRPLIEFLIRELLNFLEHQRPDSAGAFVASLLADHGVSELRVDHPVGEIQTFRVNADGSVEPIMDGEHNA